MPGSDSDPDKIQTYGPDNSGKSKTSQIAPEQVGRENARTGHKAGAMNAESVTTAESVTVTDGEATDTIHYGRNQDRANAGDESVAVGVGARATGGGDRHVAVGYQAAQNNTGDDVTASGYQAAQNNTGNDVTAFGYRAAQNNTDNRFTAFGYQAARANGGFAGTASGYQAVENNTGNRVAAFGYQAARDNTGNRVTASGFQAAQNNTGNRVTAWGHQAARGDGLADPTTMGSDNIGIGASAIRNNQASGLIAIGQEAGINAQTDDQLIITDQNGNRRLVMNLTNGNLSIEGSLTENATL